MGEALRSDQADRQGTRIAPHGVNLSARTSLKISMKLRRFAITILAALSFFFAQTPATALDAHDLEDLLGYTMVAHTNVKGDFEGADFDKLVALDNGMIFEFSTYSYTYAYRPAVAIFARTVSPDELRRRGIPNVSARPITLYKLVIDEEIYDVTRIR